MEPTSSPFQPRYLDYRYRLVIADATALGLIISAAGAPGDSAPTALALAGLGMYVLGAPAVHVANGQPLRGLASLGARVGFPVAGFAVGLVSRRPCAPETRATWTTHRSAWPFCR